MDSKHETVELEYLDIDIVGRVVSGSKLFHPKFGVGEVVPVLKIVASGESTVHINFEYYGSKWILPEYANFTVPKDKITLRSLFAKWFKIDKNS